MTSGKTAAELRKALPGFPEREYMCDEWRDWEADTLVGGRPTSLSFELSETDGGYELVFTKETRTALIHRKYVMAQRNGSLVLENPHPIMRWGSK